MSLMADSATVVFASYEFDKIRQAYESFKRFIEKHDLSSTRLQTTNARMIIHGCDYSELKKRSIVIKGPSETLLQLPYVKVPKGVLLKFA